MSFIFYKPTIQQTRRLSLCNTQRRVQDFLHQGQIPFLGGQKNFIRGKIVPEGHGKMFCQPKKTSFGVWHEMPSMRAFHDGQKLTIWNFLRGRNISNFIRCVFRRGICPPPLILFIRGICTPLLTHNNRSNYPSYFVCTPYKR